MNLRVLTVVGLINSQRESVNPGQTVEKDPKSKIECSLFAPQTVLKVLAKEVIFICMTVLPPSGQSITFCMYISDLSLSLFLILLLIERSWLKC